MTACAPPSSDAIQALDAMLTELQQAGQRFN